MRLEQPRHFFGAENHRQGLGLELSHISGTIAGHGQLRGCCLSCFDTFFIAGSRVAHQLRFWLSVHGALRFGAIFFLPSSVVGPVLRRMRRLAFGLSERGHGALFRFEFVSFV